MEAARLRDPVFGARPAQARDAIQQQRIPLSKLIREGR
jgi:hypothetical protein